MVVLCLGLGSLCASLSHGILAESLRLDIDIQDKVKP
jgi:hypothetical protein